MITVQREAEVYTNAEWNRVAEIIYTNVYASRGSCHN